MSSIIPGEADRDKSREMWVQTVRTATDHGRPVRTVKAKTPKEAHMAQLQTYWLSKRSYGGFHPNYELIDWKH